MARKGNYKKKQQRLATRRRISSEFQKHLKNPNSSKEDPKIIKYKNKTQLKNKQRELRREIALGMTKFNYLIQDRKRQKFEAKFGKQNKNRGARTNRCGFVSDVSPAVKSSR